jgi:molecular chaperone GrpE
MIDRQELANQLLDYLQTAPELPEYLGEAPESLPSFDPYQMVGESIALRQEVKQQNKLMQSAQLALQQALDIERSRNEQLQAATIKAIDDRALFKDLLSVMDDLDRTIAHIQGQIAAAMHPKPQEVGIWRKLFFGEPKLILDPSLMTALTSSQEGIEMIRRSLLAILRQRQIAPIVALGQPFDSECMYAIAQQPSDSVPANCVIQEVVRGYRQGDRIIREAQVIVASHLIE